MLLQDIRYGFRSLRANLTLTVIAIACLALGIGVNTTIFSVVDGVLIQPFPYTEPDRLVILNEAHHQTGVREAGISFLDLRDWRDESTAFSGVAAVQFRSLTISDGDEPERFLGAAVSWNLFSLLGIVPAHGRSFVADDDVPGAAPVVIMSDPVWRTRYQADPSIVGRSILVNAQPHTVIGVMPPNFEFPTNQKLWVPLEPLLHATPRNERGIDGYARLKPGSRSSRRAVR